MEKQEEILRKRLSAVGEREQAGVNEIFFLVYYDFC
jgi:hypothetical protein